jgi:membrane protease YdiL (CAAX protease family)
MNGDARRPSHLGVAAGLIAGCAALILRPPATVGGWGLVVGVGALGICLPLAPAERIDGRRWVWVLAVATGVVAFAAARMLVMPASGPGTLLAAMVTGVAAVAEEAFFRRLMFGWLARWGNGVAIAGTAVAFAVVHLRAYGVWSVPVNLGAGVLLGWQRWATGRWSAAAATHVVANLLQIM